MLRAYPGRFSCGIRIAKSKLELAGGASITPTIVDDFSPLVKLNRFSDRVSVTKIFPAHRRSDDHVSVVHEKFVGVSGQEGKREHFEKIGIHVSNILFGEHLVSASEDTAHFGSKSRGGFHFGQLIHDGSAGRRLQPSERLNGFFGLGCHVSKLFSSSR